MSQQRILVTGGHMTPALAVIAELQKRGSFEFLWVGHKYNQFGNKNTSPEFSTVTSSHIQFRDLVAGKFTRNWGGDNWIAGLTNLIKIPLGFLHSLIIILQFNPKLIISFGGYLALPIVVMGKLLGKKVVTHEQTAVTGLTNKILPNFADKVFISWPSSAKYYPAQKTFLTGNPIRREIFVSHSNSFPVNPELPTIYLTGGNQGSHKLNQALFSNLDQLLELANIIHQTGNSSVTNDFATAEELAAKYANKPGKYIVRDYVYQTEIGEAFAKSALVLARSGANTVYEVLALAKVAIFVPIPWVTHNEQFVNASVAKETGIAEILTEAELTPENLFRLIAQCLSNYKQGLGPTGVELDVAEAKAQSVVRLDAATQIVDQLWEYL